MDYITVYGKRYAVDVTYKEGRTSTADVKGDKIVFKIIRSLSKHDGCVVLKKLRKAILRKLEKLQLQKRNIRLERFKDYKDGDIIEDDGSNFRIRIAFEDKNRSSAKTVEDEIHLSVSSRACEHERRRHIPELMRMALSKTRSSHLRKTVEELNRRHFNVPFKDVKFRKQTRCWGRCSADGEIRIYHRLINAPWEILVYVCIHELSHLRERNHLNSFWALVEGAMSDYRETMSG